MKVLNFGSLNVDYVYDVPYFVRAGETISTTGRSVFSGGKGLNQSVATAKTGLTVYHAGLIGNDGGILLKTLQENRVHTDYIRKLNTPGGHTVIQVDSNGQNCIIVFGGTNQQLTENYMDEVLLSFSKGDFLLVQNEVNNVETIIRKAHSRGLTVVLNPSPCDEKMKALPLETVDYLVINETEGMVLAGTEKLDEIIPILSERSSRTRIILTQGKSGSEFYDGAGVFRQSAFPMKAMDTTAAGDTFLGYAVYGIAEGMTPQEILELASKAAAISVTRKGASVSIPALDEVLAYKF
jgi:ribokinase